MGEQGLNNLMGANRSRLSEIGNAIVIDKFNGKKRMVTFAGDTVNEDEFFHPELFMKPFYTSFRKPGNFIRTGQNIF